LEAILYITRKKLKNTILRLVRRPARLIVTLASLALIVWMLLDLPSQSGGEMDIAVLQSGYLAWLLVLGTITAMSSLESGSALFQLSDVNLLFVSPLSPKTTLAYGLMQQTGKTFAGFIFLLFYSGMLIENFGLGATDVLVLILGTVVFLVVVQILAQCLYCIANRGAVQRAGIKGGILFVPLIFALFVLYRIQHDISWQAVYTAAASPVLDAFPIIGWVRGAVFALIAEDMQGAMLYIALTAAALLLVVFLFIKIDADYYEDVLSSAEKTFELRRAMKEKRSANLGRKKKVGKTGINAGWGASVFFFKHLCEARRRNRFPFSGSTVLLLLVNLGVTGIMTLVSRNNGEALDSTAALVVACGLSIYLLFFQNAAGEWSKELQKPYLYLVPEKPFRKLLWASLSTVLGTAMNGFVAFTLLGFIFHANPFMVAACILAYAAFGTLFTAGSVLGRSVLGSIPNRGIIMVLYMLLLLLVMAPGIAGTLFIVFALQADFFAAPLVIAMPIIIWNVFVSFLILYGCQNLLSSWENS
jgi:hypothetical protein